MCAVRLERTITDKILRVPSNKNTISLIEHPFDEGIVTLEIRRLDGVYHHIVRVSYYMTEYTRHYPDGTVSVTYGGDYLGMRDRHRWFRTDKCVRSLGGQYISISCKKCGKVLVERADATTICGESHSYELEMSRHTEACARFLFTKMLDQLHGQHAFQNGRTCRTSPVQLLDDYTFKCIRQYLSN